MSREMLEGLAVGFALTTVAQLLFGWMLTQSGNRKGGDE